MTKIHSLLLSIFLLTGVNIGLTGCFNVRAETRPLTFLQTPRQPMDGINSYSISDLPTEYSRLSSLEIPGLQKTIGNGDILVQFKTNGLKISGGKRRVEKYEDKDKRVVTIAYIDYSAQLTVEMTVSRGNTIIPSSSKVFIEKGDYTCKEENYDTSAIFMSLSDKYISAIEKQAQNLLTSEFGTCDRQVMVSIWSNSDFEEFESAKANALRALSARSIGDNTEAVKQWELAIPRWKAIISNVETDKDGKPKFKDAHKAAASFNIAQALIWTGKLNEAKPYAKRAQELSGNDSDYRNLPDFIDDLIKRKSANPAMFKL